MRTIIHKQIIFKITDPGFDVPANSHEEIVNKQKNKTKNSFGLLVLFCSGIFGYLGVIEAVVSFSETGSCSRTMTPSAPENLKQNG